MVAMYHSIEGRMPDGTIEKHESRMLVFGTPFGDTAMSETVGYTTGELSCVQLIRDCDDLPPPHLSIPLMPPSSLNMTTSPSSITCMSTHGIWNSCCG
jgi:hypothetical protein